MKLFKDNQDRDWEIEINVTAVKRVRDLIEVDLLSVAEGELLDRLAADPVLLCNVIYAICKPAADAAKISDEQFGQAMAGDAIDHATTALLAELVDFFPKSRRQLLSKALTKLRKLESMAVAAAEAKLDSDEIEKQMAAELDFPDLPKNLGGSSGGSPESSASSPDA